MFRVACRRGWSLVHFKKLWQQQIVTLADEVTCERKHTRRLRWLACDNFCLLGSPDYLRYVMERQSQRKKGDDSDQAKQHKARI
jgi:hypothetical protein